MLYLDWLWIKFAWTLACFFERVVCAICCSGIFEIWSKVAINIFQKYDKIRRRVPQGRPKLVQGDTPQRFRKTGRKKKRATPGKSHHATGSKMGRQIARLAIFLVIFFDIFPNQFLGLILNCFFNGFGNIFCINFMLYLDVFGYFFETSCFG